MAAALFAGAAFGGGGAGVTILGLGCRVDGVLGCVARGRRGRGPARFSSSDLYKAVGAGLLRVAKVAKRFDLRQFVGYLVCCLAASKLEDFLAYRESDTLRLQEPEKRLHAGRRSRGWVPSDPGRRHGDGRSEAPGTLQTAGRLVQTGTSPRRPAARRSRTRGNWRPSSDAPRPATSGPARTACD